MEISAHFYFTGWDLVFPPFCLFLLAAQWAFWEKPFGLLQSMVFLYFIDHFSTTMSSNNSINFILINTYLLLIFCIMGCSNCKQKKEMAPPTKESLERLAQKTEKVMYGAFIIWSVFAVYGIYSFVKNFLWKMENTL